MQGCGEGGYDVRLWGWGISVMERCVEMCVHEKGERHIETCVYVCVFERHAKCVRDVLGHRRKVVYVGGVGRECV